MSQPTTLQPDAQQTAPIAATDRAARCSRCQAEGQDGDRCQSCGSFLPANAANYRHGLRAFQAAGRLPEDLRQSVEDWRTAIVAAQGGLAELEAEPLRAGLIRSLVNAEVIERLAVAAIAETGLRTREGKALAAVLGTAADRKARLTALLGLERRQRSVTTSPLQWLEERAK